MGRPGQGARGAKAVAVRRGFYIHAFVGANGGGKTLCAVRTLLPSMAAGRPVLSTTRLLAATEGWTDAADVPDDPLYVRLNRLSQLVNVRGADLLMDEVAASASSHQSERVPAEVEITLQQLRKLDARLFWTAPDWRRAQKFLRELSRAVTYCKGFMPVTESDGDRSWRQTRGFVWTTFDASAFDEFQLPTTERRRKAMRRVCREIYWRPRHVDQWRYDTYSSVDRLVDDLPDKGDCLCCGMPVPKGRCDCAKSSCVCLDLAGRPTAHGTAVAANADDLLVATTPAQLVRLVQEDST